MAEVMMGRGGARRAPEAVEKEKLVPGVHGGVDRFAHHGGAAGEGGRREFGHGDRRVAGEGGMDDELRGMSGHGKDLGSDARGFDGEAMASLRRIVGP